MLRNFLAFLFFSYSFFALSQDHSHITGFGTVLAPGDYFTIVFKVQAKCFKKYEDMVNNLNSVVHETVNIVNLAIDDIEELKLDYTTEGPLYREYSYQNAEDDICNNTWQGTQELNFTFCPHDPKHLNILLNRLHKTISENYNKNESSENVCYIDLGRPVWHLNQESLSKYSKLAQNEARNNATEKFLNLLGDCFEDDGYKIVGINDSSYSTNYSSMESSSRSYSPEGVLVKSSNLHVDYSAVFHFSYTAKKFKTENN